MRVRLDYDRGGLEVELPDRHVVKRLGCRSPDPLPDGEAAIVERIERPTGTAALAELARGRHNACLVVCDVTRPVPNHVVLPPLLSTLERSGIPRREILILIATGLHRPNLGDELREMLGPFVAENYRIENHCGQALSEHTRLADSPRGLPVWIDTRYIQADLKITTGLIEPHFMAGFSGGRKLICPGLAAMETIRPWHSPDFLEHPNARTGCVQDNPVHEENTAIARLAGCDFIVNVVIGRDRQILKVVAGDMEEAFAEGVRFVRGVVTDTVPEPVDVVVTSSAGYPLDTTFYQSVKGMVAALPIVKPGGTIVLAAGMTQGIGSDDFQRLFDENRTPEAFMQRILHTDYFVQDQWQLEEMAKVLRHAKVKVVTGGLRPETLRRLFVEPADSVEQAVADAVAEYGSETTIAVMPEGPYVMASVA
ncbi:MAG: nickel-dependent lactate racemase [Candidatus Nealsonbacteria bacterium]|nr:nickel-dependent lactate racemase [Candidatus Nealsonbacteria bacterium]